MKAIIYTPIPWLEWRYSITEYGDVISYLNWNHNWKHIIAYKNKYTWYVQIALMKNKKCVTYKIHRLVALTYIPNPNNFPVVRHLDNNKHNNHVSNLDWCTHSTNVQQKHDDWLHPVTERMRESSRQKWYAQRKKIMQLTKEWTICQIYESVKMASRITWIAQWNISMVAVWRDKSAGGYNWKFLT